MNFSKLTQLKISTLLLPILMVSLFILASCNEENSGDELKEHFNIQWMKIIDTPKETWGMEVALDQNNSIYMVGNSSLASETAIVAKYTQNGDISWVCENDPSKMENGYDIALDGNGIAYITIRKDFDNIIGKVDLTTGTLLSTASFGNNLSGGTKGVRIALDKSNNLIVAGYVGGNLNGEINSGQTDGFVMKLSPSTNMNTLDVLWTRLIGTPAEEELIDIVLDSDDNCYVTGLTLGNLDGEHIGNSNNAMFVAKLDSSGVVQWKKQYDPMDAGCGVGIALNHEKEIYISGLNFEIEAAFVSKLSSSGDINWISYFDSAAGIRADSIAVDNKGNAFIAGHSHGNVMGQKGFGMDDIFMAKLNDTGEILAVKILGTEYRDKGYGITLDTNGNCYITGFKRSTDPIQPYAFVLKANVSR